MQWVHEFHEVWMAYGWWHGWSAFGGTIFFQLLVRDLFKAPTKPASELARMRP
jgi:hypothetical protein